MQSEPKLWHRAVNDCWYVTLSEGKKQRQRNLGKDEQRARREYHKILAQHCQPASTEEITVAALAVRFLQWNEINRSLGTTNFYREGLDVDSERSFPHFVGGLRAAAVQPFHVDGWIVACFPKSKETHRHNLMRQVDRMLNWGVRMGLLVANPVKGRLEKPQPNSSELFLTEEKYNTVLAAIKDENFRDYVEVLWLSGCRPKELRMVKKPNVKEKRIIFARRNSKGKRFRRVIVLCDRAWEIVQRLVKANGSKGCLFRNSKDRPWCKDSIGLRFQRLSDKVGFTVTAYSLRHSFGTRAIKNLPTAMVSKLMGHVDTRQVTKTYGHLTPDDLLPALEALNKKK
jgi:integrase